MLQREVYALEDSVFIECYEEKFFRSIRTSPNTRHREALWGCGQRTQKAEILLPMKSDVKHLGNSLILSDERYWVLYRL